MRIALVCPRTGAFIRVAVVMMAAYDRVAKRQVTRPYVGIVPYDPPGRRLWSEADVARCERNERFFRTEEDARAFARTIARTLQTSTSLGGLSLLEGKAERIWHDSQFCVA